MLNDKDAYKYEIPYNGIFEITQYWINGTFVFKMGAIKIIIIYTSH